MHKTVRAFLFFILWLSLYVFAELGKLPKIAVLNLKNTEGITEGEAELLSDRLRNELFSTGMVEVMEREQMQAVLKEQGFQQSGVTCSEEGCMVEAGKLLGVKILISGSIGKLGKLILVNVKSIDVETAKIAKVVSEDINGDIEDVVKVLPAIALKLTCCAPGVNKALDVQKVELMPSSVTETSTENEEPPPEPTGLLPCDGTIFIEQISLPKNIIGFSLPQNEADEIDDMLKDAFEEAFDRNTMTASAAQLSQTNCKALTIRLLPKSYTIKKAMMKQFNGTMSVDIAIFASPQAAEPIIKVAYKRTGDRHWGDIEPLNNAFEAIVEDIEDDFYDLVKKTLSKGGYLKK